MDGSVYLDTVNAWETDLSTNYSTYSCQWSADDSSVTFVDGDTLSPTVTLPDIGVYRLKLELKDPGGVVIGYDYVNAKVEHSELTVRAEASESTVAIGPYDDDEAEVSLYGLIVGGEVDAVEWVYLGGDGDDPTIADSASLATEGTFTSEGTYDFALLAKEGDETSGYTIVGSDIATITVSYDQTAVRITSDVEPDELSGIINLSSDQPLNLITSVEVEKANTPDTQFVEPAIAKTVEVTGQKIEKVFADGAYQSPANDACCEGIDMVFTGIQGAPSRYDLEMTSKELLVTDTKTGEQQIAVPVKKTKNSKEDKWRIKSTEGKFIYFGQQAIRASELRRQLRKRPVEELHRRNNVEATIFQFAYTLRNNKSKYRRLVKQRTFAYCRCLYINLVRIMLLEKQICQRTSCALKKLALSTIIEPLLTIYRSQKLMWAEYLARFFITMIYKNLYVVYR